MQIIHARFFTNLACEEASVSLAKVGCRIAVTPSNPKGLWFATPWGIPDSMYQVFVFSAFTPESKNEIAFMEPASNQDFNWYVWGDPIPRLPIPTERDLTIEQAQALCVFWNVQPEQKISDQAHILYQVNRESPIWRIGLFQSWLDDPTYMQIWAPSEVAWETRPYMYTRLIFGYR